MSTELQLQTRVVFRTTRSKNTAVGSEVCKNPT